MKSPFKVSGFERRLAALFLLLSVVPALVIAVFSARYFVEGVQKVSNPGVEQSFANSMEIARDFSARLEEDAACTALRLADEYERAGAPDAGPALMGAMDRVLRETHADFAAIYRLEGEAWRLRTVHPPGFTRLDRDIAAGKLRASAADSAAAPIEETLSDPDIIASGLERGGTLFVAGFALEQGFAEKIHGTADDLLRYRAVDLYAKVKSRYIIIVTAILVVAAAIASALASRLVARRISHPITELAAATERVAKGDLGYRVVVPARDEVLSLVNGFNKMTQELQENKVNLIRAERIAAWRDVARRIAHEIKNPLTPMEIAIYRIKKRLAAESERAATDAGRAADPERTAASAPIGAGDDPEQAARDRAVIEESLDSILKEVEALKSIAQEFSAFARLPEPRFERLDLNDIARSVLELYSSSPGIELTTRLAADLPEVRADRDQVRSVVANLIKNAIEAMPGGGKLRVATAVLRAAQDEAFEAGAVRIEIADSGAGIPEEIREKVFDPYFTTKSTGSGIGLALAYRIVADHRGRISFTTGDTGTTFVVDLPLT